MTDTKLPPWLTELIAVADAADDLRIVPRLSFELAATAWVHRKDAAVAAVRKAYELCDNCGGDRLDVTADRYFIDCRTCHGTGRKGGF